MVFFLMSPPPGCAKRGDFGAELNGAGANAAAANLSVVGELVFEELKGAGANCGVLATDEFADLGAASMFWSDGLRAARWLSDPEGERTLDSECLRRSSPTFPARDRERCGAGASSLCLFSSTAAAK